MKKQVASGVGNVVTQPVCLDERHTGVNDDKRDARELALRLDRYVAGNPHALATVRVPTPEEEQQRIQSRQREQLRREVQRVAARAAAGCGPRAIIPGTTGGGTRLVNGANANSRSGWWNDWKSSALCS